MENYLIIRLSSLGDILHTLPAFSALRKNFPEARISWVVEQKGKEILDLVPGLDEIIPVEPSGWRINKSEFWSEISRLRKELKNKYQIAIDFQGLMKSAFIAFLSRAERRMGFHKKNLREPFASIFYTERPGKIPENIHVIGKNLMLLTLLGLEEKKYDFPLSLPDDLVEATLLKLKNLGFTEERKLIIFNVGAAWETKRWFPERWIEMIERLKRNELFPILLWGSEEEKALAQEIGENTQVPLTPFLTLKEVMALVKQASLLVSGDTFALQAACAFSRPVVGLFGPTNPRRNGPFSLQDQVAFHELDCSYCYKRSCSSLDCLKKVTPEEVASLCLERLTKDV